MDGKIVFVAHIFSEKGFKPTTLSLKTFQCVIVSQLYDIKLIDHKLVATGQQHLLATTYGRIQSVYMST